MKHWSVVLLGATMTVASVAMLSMGEDEVPLEDPAPQAAGVAEEVAPEPEPEVEVPALPPLEELVPPPDHPAELRPTAVPDAPEPAPVSRPVHIEVAAIGVDHPVIDVGLHPDGSMEVPDDVHELGWYEPGVMPGELGSAVLAGHVDSARQGPGAFFDLRLLEVGDAIEVTDEAGVTRAWTVDRVVRYGKDSVPMDDIFRWDGDSADLVLVTCGGDFNSELRSYEDNIVVYASQ